MNEERNKRTDGHFNEVPTNINFSKIWRRTNVADALTSRTHLRRGRTYVDFKDVRTYVNFFTFGRTNVGFLALDRTYVNPYVGSH